MEAMQPRANLVAEIPKDQPIVCVCRSGNRSQVAAEQLSQMGFADVTNHLSTERLRSLMKSNLFIYHGYTELWLENKCSQPFISIIRLKSGIIS